MRAEAADGNGTNNANFSTPAADAGTPRMQMFQWPGNQFGPQNTVSLGEQTFNAGWSRFTPPVTNAGVTGQYVLAGNGCDAGLYPGTLPGGTWIAVVDGGTGMGGCSNNVRVQIAEGLGASAVIVLDSGTGTILSGSAASAPPTIPAVLMPATINVQEQPVPNGTAFKAALEADGGSGTLRKNPAHPGIRDGDLDNGIIIHEYGHGVSLRLTGGPGINCLTGNEQAGEGWSDYLAIVLNIDPALDDPESTRGLVPYALFQDSRSGNGLRPRPYSRNMDIQPFTYDSIKTGGWLNGTSLALPHGLGHGWAAVLWDLTWDLIDKHGFNPDIYGAWDSGGNNRSLQYVIDGLKLQGCGPGLVRARDAIIQAADELTDGGDTCTVWASFARRGLGYSAVQGTTNRNDNDEAFDTHPDCRRPFQAPTADQAAINNIDAGDVRPLRFTAGGYRGLDVLASNSPYSRRVDCETLRTVGPGPFITPRPTPVAAQTPGNSKLTVNSTGVYLPVADRGGMGRHLPRAGPHPRRRRAAQGVLPLPVADRPTIDPGGAGATGPSCRLRGPGRGTV